MSDGHETRGGYKGIDWSNLADDDAKSVRIFRLEGENAQLRGNSLLHVREIEHLQAYVRKLEAAMEDVLIRSTASEHADHLRRMRLEAMTMEEKK